MKPPARYDGFASRYDEYIGSEALMTVALASLGNLLGRGPGTVLDVGCGTGIAFPTLVALGWTVTGTDISADQLAVAKQRADTVGARLVHANAAELPFADRSFDAVVSVLTHTDFDDVAAAFRDSARVLAPAGRFAYVGVHPCFVGPMVERREGEPPLLSAGYRRVGWWPDAGGPIRSHVGVNHIPLAALLNAVIDAGLRLDRIEEPGDDGYPMLLSLRAIRVPLA